MKEPIISIIAAIGSNRELGRNNKLLWHIPEDLKRFKQLTSGHPIIMGRKTFESIGRPLPNRLNIIITRDPEFKAEGITVVHSLDEAIKIAAEYCSSSETSPHPSPYRRGNTNLPLPKGEDRGEGKEGKNGEIFIIGGGQIFEQAMQIADKLYLTIVDGSFDADVFFPDYSMFTKVTSEQKGESNGYKYRFLDLEK